LLENIKREYSGTIALKGYFRSINTLLDDPVVLCIMSGVEWDLNEEQSICLDEAIEIDIQFSATDWPIAEPTQKIGSETYAVFKPRFTTPPSSDHNPPD